MNDRFRSALMGTALGDSWGYPYQESPQTDSTPFPDQLIISDDTQMTLALSTAMRIINQQNLDREAGMRTIGEQFLDYFSDPDYDRSPGTATTESLDRLGDMGASHWQTCSSRSGSAGAVMRVSASALLAPPDQGVGWSVMQAVITHESALARAASAMMATLLLAPKGSNLLDVAEGLVNDANFDKDEILSEEEKASIITYLDSAMVRDVQGPSVPMTEILARLREVHRIVSPSVGQGNFEDLYTLGNKFLKIFGRSFDAASCVASALLLAQFYVDHHKQYSPHDFLHVAVNWPGNRNTRASVTGALIGAHVESMDAWESFCTYSFEPRYNQAIHTGVWNGFKPTPIVGAASH